MRTFGALRGVAVAVCVTAGLTTVMVSNALAAASPIYLCIGTKPSQGVRSGGSEGKCPKPTEKITYTRVALPSEEAEQQKLLAILPYMKYVASGVGGKPTIQFSGVNVQVINGAGETATTNGAGNLVIGYNENPGEQTGSHSLVLGQDQTFTSYGSVVGGEHNTDTGPYAVVYGESNTVGEGASSVLGGIANSARGFGASVTGGESNEAFGVAVSVTGGTHNEARGVEGRPGSTITGGYNNSTDCEDGTVSGGANNVARGTYSWIGGGEGNAAGQCAIGHGGLEELTGGAVSGGYHNFARASLSSIFGGKELTATNEYEAIP